MSDLEKYRKLREAAEKLITEEKHAADVGRHDPYFFSILCRFRTAATPELVLEVLDLLAEYEQRRKEDSRYMAALSTELQEAKRDAERYRWLCDGNGYFLEEQMLCGHSNEKGRAAIDATRTGASS
ncbi:hypothetical protein NQH47_00270 [Burkholderia pseudomallei]|uniref:hypothetical protein n=1 Tax=Burkholderia pseudomallei TaxID=28450 RepID=UPI0003A6EBDC|nr:hypothetical protein [Burkholderia pseudomallei]MCE2035857.1 hypothetical protein [Burkholderia pseudomallei CS]MCE2041865.1 hypothetical protein [Burkholderia pseudomallei CB]MCQ8219732.1 hypothetical protein [Burkholderia pseudomallei]QFS13092.1 hypothetical protein H10_33390 [Burkholderia pseudomallei]CAK1286780.1 Uncharacterised protein [Burkholderia pseudomallei]